MYTRKLLTKKHKAMEKEVINYRGYEIETFYDEDPMHPRKDCDNVGIMACASGKYSLGDELILGPIEWLEDKLGLLPGEVYTNTRLRELEGKFFDKFFALRLYLYDHSGLSISAAPFSCPWDSGQVGYIYTTRERINDFLGITRLTKKAKERIEKALLYEVEEFDQYLTGDVYGYNSEAGGCSSFFGKEGYELMIEEAKSEIDSLILYKQKKRNAKVKTLIINNVPIYKRPELVQ